MIFGNVKHHFKPFFSCSLLKAYKKIDKMGSVLLFFLKREWTFESGRVSRLKNKMSDGDRKIFFCDLKNFDWEEYLKYHIQGVRIYLMKDPLDTLPQGLKKMRR